MEPSKLRSLTKNIHFELQRKIYIMNQALLNLASKPAILLELDTLLKPIARHADYDLIIKVVTEMYFGEEPKVALTADEAEKMAVDEEETEKDEEEEREYGDDLFPPQDEDEDEDDNKSPPAKRSCLRPSGATESKKENVTFSEGSSTDIAVLLKQLLATQNGIKRKTNIDVTAKRRGDTVDAPPPKKARPESADPTTRRPQPIKGGLDIKALTMAVDGALRQDSIGLDSGTDSDSDGDEMPANIKRTVYERKGAIINGASKAIDLKVAFELKRRLLEDQCVGRYFRGADKPQQLPWQRLTAKSNSAYAEDMTKAAVQMTKAIGNKKVRFATIMCALLPKIGQIL